MAEKVDYILKYRKLISAICTILFAAGLILICFLIVFKTKLPVFPEDTGGGGGSLGIEVNLGNSADGMGITQADEINTPDFQAKPVVAETAPQQSEELVADETGETISKVKNEKKKDKKHKEEIVAKADNKETKEVKETKEEQKVNSKALFKSSKSSNQGETNKAGDQGNPNGTIYSKNYNGTGGGGNGTGVGRGGGNGNGDGTGTGSGKGKGVSFKLEGRTKKILPTPKYDIQESGIVVVDIVVNRSGIVIRANSGGKGSTTSNRTLCRKAEEAAMKTVFTSKDDAPEEQKGTITYHFILN